MRVEAILLAVLLLVGHFGPVVGQDRTKPDEEFELLRAKVKQGEKQALKLLSSDDFVKNDPRGTQQAFAFLGSVRSTAAIPTLCKRLLVMKKLLVEIEPRDSSDVYPASAALVQIGSPAVEGLLLTIGSSETSENYREIAFTVMEGVVGKDAVLDSIDGFKAKVKAAKSDPRYEGMQVQRLDNLRQQFKKRWMLR